MATARCGDPVRSPRSWLPGLFVPANLSRSVPEPRRRRNRPADGDCAAPGAWPDQMGFDENRFWNGSRISLRHCFTPTDMHNYQGVEIHLLLVDEPSHFTAGIYRFLRSRVRSVTAGERWKKSPAAHHLRLKSGQRRTFFCQTDLGRSQAL